MAGFLQNESSPSLPNDLIMQITQYLNLADQKQLRLVSRSCRDIVTFYCFRQVNFDVSKTGIIRLTKIASTKHLAGHVRVLNLQRKRRMPNIPNYEKLREVAYQPGDPEVYWPGCDFADCDEEGVIPYRDWSRHTAYELKRLHRKYIGERKTAHENFRSLSKRLCSSCSKQNHSAIRSSPTREDCIVRTLIDSFEKFTGLTSFKHSPAILWNDRWIRCWQGIRIGLEFSPKKEKKDEKIEALHLACALAALRAAKPGLPKIERMDFNVQSPAFWGSEDMRRLWECRGYDSSLLGLHWKDNNSTTAARLMEREKSDQDQRTNDYGSLGIMKNAREDLTSLTCSVTEEFRETGPSMVTEPFVEFLCHNKKLNKVCLKFGPVIDGVLQFSRSPHIQPDAARTLLTSLTERKPWSDIQQIKLEISTDQGTLLSFLKSISTTLRHLTLSNVKLAYLEGKWETLLLEIVSSLDNLNGLDAENLSEHNMNGHETRLLFCPEKWTDRENSYYDIKERVIGHLLRTKQLHEEFPYLVTFK